MSETERSEIEPTGDGKNPDQRNTVPVPEQRGSGLATFMGYVIVALQYLWVGTRWASIKTMDISLWLILSLTENTRSVRPTIRVTFSKEERSVIARSQGYRCMYCGVRLRTENLQIDHMYPVSRGGSNEYDNLQALCRRCNIRKGNHTDEEFRERYYELVGDYMEPPASTIPQRYFDEIRRSTDAHEGVKEANRNRYLTPGQRVMRSLPIAIGFWTVVFTLASAFWFESLVSQALLAGLIFGVAYAGGLWLRARKTGVFDE